MMNILPSSQSKQQQEVLDNVIRLRYGIANIVEAIVDLGLLKSSQVTMYIFSKNKDQYYQVQTFI